MSSILNTSSSAKASFSVRIVVCDHYSTRPTPGIDVIYSDFRGSDIKQVPVLRIFGSTPDGHKACLHIHGVFPYFYVPCPTPNPEPQFLYQVAASLDKALNIAMKQATSANQHVYKISLVKGLPFYGFHYKDHIYLKIFLYNPGLIKQAVDLCSNGAILGQTFQPHESHLNFTLQFFIDFNLFGMSYIDLQSVKFRRNTGNTQSSSDPLDSPDDYPLKPESTCFYEADCMASHIINRQRVGKGDGIENPGLEEVWNQEKQRRQQLNISMASKSLSQGRLKAEETDSHYKFEQIFLVKMSNLIDKPVSVEDSNINNVDINYPAESMEGSQLYKAMDVSMHLPDNSLGVTMNETLRNTQIEDLDDTLVDESVALNSSLSLHYSQVLLDSEDLDLLDVLKDMDDEKPVEDDSVMGTPAADDNEEPESDDAEYSQIFNEDTIIMEPYKNKDDVDDSSPAWNDSFWDDVNIPQLDGPCDDDHVKKVRKRKMRPFKLGLSRPKSKRKVSTIIKEEPVSMQDESDSDEINVSRETIDSISSLHLKKAAKVEMKSASETTELDQDSQFSNDSIADLVNKVTTKYENIKLEVSENYDRKNSFEPVAGPSTSKLKSDDNSDNCDKNHDSYESSPDDYLKLETSKNYDLKNKFEPEAGPSTSKEKSDENSNCNINNDSHESSPDNDFGFISFYNASKLFDVSQDDRHESITEIANKSIDTEEGDKSTKYDTSLLSEQDIKLHYSETPLVSNANYLENVDTDKPRIATVILTPKFRPPTKSYVESTLEKYNIPKVKNIEPYYSDHKDVGDKVEIGHMVIKVQSKLAQDQKPFEKVLNTTSIEEWRQLIFLQNNQIAHENIKPDNLKTILASNRQCVLETVIKPPTAQEVIKWMKNKEIKDDSKTVEVNEVTNIIDDLDNSQLLGLNEVANSLDIDSSDKDKSNINDSLQVTMQPDGSFLCFGSGQEKDPSDTPLVEINYLTIMIIEVHTAVRGDLNPDPLTDEIKAVFINITNDCPPEHFLQKSQTRIIVVDSETPPKRFDRCVFGQDITYVDNERDIIEKVIELIRKHDPDIMCGFEIEMSSWGYLFERSQVLGYEIVMEISRITEKHRQKRWRNRETDFEGRIIGRILFNVWRLFRHELALSSYSFENCMYEVLKERVPKYSYAELSAWWTEDRMMRWVPVEYYLTRLSGTIRMMEKLDIINRTAELARLFGLQWLEVLTRGSQFRVESLMLRAARPLNLIALSPTVKQRAAMRAPECLPLIFEPESRFYSDPMIVLDFQSLYPSMMIAYNYCFSTCIGRVQNINGDASYEFGAWRLRIPKSKLQSLVKNNLVHWSPVGVGFVKPSVRRGVLPALLRRILAARQAVKKSMKMQTDGGVKKALHSRQLGLKLIANVTYGYTAANFSGRMPCCEVGDSVVAKGRETLERAIQLVRDNPNWNAKVVYGDTDSMFVQVPGGTRHDAFAIGQQIADAVTADNPSPVALKLEKVYQPCILQTKKRYVGFMYESADQLTPVYEAKGIETVRRDGCPIAVKTLQSSLCTLFTCGDISRIRSSVCAVLHALCADTLPVQELVFTREYHGVSGYRPGAAAPPNEIANRRLVRRDPRALPATNQRVAWIVTSSGAPGRALVKLARTPDELRREPSLRPNVIYYATRAILPPLHRCFSLLGVDVFKWWTTLSYNRTPLHTNPRGGITRYLARERCALCSRPARTHSLCAACAVTSRAAILTLTEKVKVNARRLKCCRELCTSCCGHRHVLACRNTECPLLWSTLSAEQRLAHAQELVSQMPVQLCDF